MRQETIDQRINPCDETLAEGLERKIQGARFADGPRIFFPEEAASNPPRKLPRSATTAVSITLDSTPQTPPRRRNSTGMFLA
jgi:hypothetical protein